MTRIHHQTTAEDTVVVTVDWLQQYGRDWLRYRPPTRSRSAATWTPPVVRGHCSRRVAR
jgi:hypothetical protein